MFSHDGQELKGKAKSRMGKLIAGGFRLALCQIRGDMNILKELFRFKSSYQHLNCCHRCPASKIIAALSFKSVFLPDARWLLQPYTHEEILDKIGELYSSAICDVDGFHFSRVLQDALHGLHLGPAAHLLGGVLEIIAGAKRSTNLLGLWNAFNDWCKAQHISHSVPPFSCGMINMGQKKQSNKCPEWKCNAWNCRLVICWLAFYTGPLVRLQEEMLMFNTALACLARFLFCNGKARTISYQGGSSCHED